MKQDCPFQGQAQLDQRVVFCFVTLRLKRGGGVSIDKNENHGLEMHFKSFDKNDQGLKIDFKPF